jgi:hypothetical protein
MVDVMCPLSFEDLDALLGDEQLPSGLLLSSRTRLVPSNSLADMRWS